jgi:hypothetical protein
MSSVDCERLARQQREEKTMDDRNQRIYVRTDEEATEILRDSRLTSLNEELGLHDEPDRASEVIVVDADGRVVRDYVSEQVLDALIAEYYEALGPARKDADGHWQICERWAYGRRIGWCVVHEGDAYQEVGYQEEGPEPTREAAAAVMAAHLRAAIAKARD